MTQIVVTLANNADENFLRRMIENMKGVVRTSLTHSDAKYAADSSELLDSLHAIRKDIDLTVIDHSDPRTHYLMSK